MNLIIFICLLLTLTSQVRAYGSGAPIVTCDSMTPGHDVKAQTTPSPFQVKARTAHVAVDSPLEIVLLSKQGESFRGFLVQVRMVGQTGENSKKAFGTFDENADPMARTLSCNGKENTAVTHQSKDQKTTVRLRWVPNEPGRYKIHATFVQTFDKFWVDVQNDEVIEVHEASHGQGHHETQEHAPQNGQGHQATQVHAPQKPMHGQGHHATQEHASQNHMYGPELCSTMKLNASLEPQTDSSSPYTFMIGPVGKVDPGDYQLVEQKGLMWINLTSDIDTPFERLFLQVRKSKDDKKAAYGQFMLPMAGKEKTNFHLVDCFGKQKNAILFVDENYEESRTRTKEINVKWEAPSDETGDFEVVGTALREGNFWDHITKDKEKSRIRVVTKKTMAQSSSSNAKPGSSSASILIMEKLSLFILILFTNL